MSYEPAAASSVSTNGDIRSSSSGGSSGHTDGAERGELLYGDDEGGMVWNVIPFTSQTMDMNWTIFPSTGKLNPGGK